MRVLLAVVLGTGLLALAPAPSARAHPDDLRTELVEISPTVLRPGADLLISGLLTNGGATPVVDPVVRMRMQRQTPSSRDALDAWLDATTPNTSNTRVLTAQPLGSDISPGATVPFTVSIPAEASPFSESSTWGPRGIEVQVTGAETYTGARSVILWFPTESPLATPTELSLLAPLTPTPAEWAAAVAAGRPVGEVAAPRITALLDATAPSDVSWALDPALLDPVAPAPLPPAAAEIVTPAPADTATQGPDPTTAPPPSAPEPPDPEGTDAPEEDRDSDVAVMAVLADRLATESSRRDVVGLAYADADLAPLARHRDFTLLRAGEARGEQVLSAAGISLLADVSWPADADRTTVEALAGAGRRAVVLPADDVPVGSDLTYTPSGRTLLTTEMGSIDAVLWDRSLSEALLGEGMTELEARQSLLAHTAVMSRERPSDARGFLAALPRDVGADPADVDGMADRLDALGDAPWLDVTNLRSLLGRTDSGEARTLRTAAQADPAALTAAELEALESDLRRMEAFAEITADPAVIRDRFEPALLSTLSRAWRADPAGRDALRGAVSAGVDLLHEQIQVAPASSILLISRRGDIPITIASALATDATVTVELRPVDARLRTDGGVEVLLPAGQSTTVRIPVTAVANGNVEVAVRVLSASDGEPVASTTSFGVRVRADWENTGTAIVAALLVVGFVVGLVRTIRSGRRRFTPEDAAPTAAGSASGPSTPPTTAPRSDQP